MEFDSNKGYRIAKIIGAKNEETVFVYDKDAMCCKKCSDNCNLGGSVCCNSCNQILIHGGNENNKVNKFEGRRDIKLNDNLKFQFMPSNLPNSQPCLLYCSGGRGVGKSVWVSKYLTQFKKLYPKYKIYLFSRKDKDDSIDDLIHKRVKVDDMPDVDLRADDFKKSMVIFDDIDTLPSDKQHNIKESVYKLLEDIIEVGRSMGIFCICTSHIPANFSESKRIINGATAITLFTSAINANTIYLLEKQLGLTKDEIKRIRSLNSRSFTVIKSVHPHVIVSDHEVYFVKNQ